MSPAGMQSRRLLVPPQAIPRTKGHTQKFIPKFAGCRCSSRCEVCSVPALHAVRLQPLAAEDGAAVQKSTSSLIRKHSNVYSTWISASAPTWQKVCSLHHMCVAITCGTCAVYNTCMQSTAAAGCATPHASVQLRIISLHTAFRYCKNAGHFRRSKQGTEAMLRCQCTRSSKCSRVRWELMFAMLNNLQLCSSHEVNRQVLQC